MKNVTILFFALVLSSCASTMPGKKLALNSKVLDATIDENPDFSNDSIKMYQISVKNGSDSWVDIDSVSLGNTAGTATVLMGGKISSWIEACTLEKKVSNYNTALFLGSVAAAGAVVGGVSNNNSTSNIGYSFALGAVAVSGVKGFIESKNKAEFQAAFPEGHIFRPFIIPPKKVIQRWILVENPKEESLKFLMVSKNKEVGEVAFEIKKDAPYVPEKDDEYPRQR